MASIRPKDEPAAIAVLGGDIFLIDGATGVRGLAASQVSVLDANLNAVLNNAILGYATTATAAGSTTLLATSKWAQYFTGSTTQTVVLPVVSTLTLNHSFYIQNSSSGALTVNSSGGNLVQTIAPGASALVSCILLTGTTAASWSVKYHAAIVASGKVLTISNSLVLAGTDGTTMTFPATSATLARTDAGQTFTGLDTFSGGVTMTGSNPTLSAVNSQGPLLLQSGGPQVTWISTDSTGYETGTAQAGAATTITLRAGASAINNFSKYVSATVTITGGTGAGQVRLIASYVGATKVATISGSNFSPAPDATSTYSIGRVDYGYFRLVADQNAIFHEVWESSSPLTGADGPFGQQDEYFRFNRFIHVNSMNYPLTGNGNRTWSLAANYVWDAETAQTPQLFKLQALSAASGALVDALVLTPNNAAPYFFTPAGVSLGIGTGAQPGAALEVATSTSTVGAKFNMNLTASNNVVQLATTSSNSSINLEFVNSTNTVSSFIRGSQTLGFYTEGNGSTQSASLAMTLANGLGVGTATDPGAGAILANTSIKSQSATAGIGYATGVGAGGAVSQLTSRTTGVTLNNITGAITLFNAAGSATAATFTVTNSAVAATDVIHISQKSGTNLYNALVTAVAAGSFNVTFFTTGGTATDSPVFSFVVIKGSAN